MHSFGFTVRTLAVEIPHDGGGRAVERPTVIPGTVVQSHLPPFQDIDSFVHCTLPVSFRRS